MFILALAGLLSGPPDVVFPGETWPLAKAEDVGLTQDQVDAALSEWARRTGPDGIKRTAIVRRGRLIHAGPESKKPNGLYSSTKSFTSTCLGLLIADGRVSLDTKAAEIEPRLSAMYPDATLRHFTTMTSGYSAQGVSRWDAENSDWSWTPYEPDVPHFPPGTAYAYWDEAQMMFGRVLTRVAEKDLSDLLNDRIFTRIGVTTQSWQPEGDMDGLPIRNGCTWLKMSARDLARFGHLMLNAGRWNGEQLVAEEWVRAATSVQVPATLPIGQTDRRNVIGSGCYGFNWWVNGTVRGEDRLLPDLPERAFFSAGLKHNVCLVVPEWGLVLVRLGEDHNPPDGHAAVLNDVARLLQPSEAGATADGE